MPIEHDSDVPIDEQVKSWWFIDFKLEERAKRADQMAVGFDGNGLEIPSDYVYRKGTVVYFENSDDAQVLHDKFIRVYQIMDQLEIKRLEPAKKEPSPMDIESEANKIQVGGDHYKKRAIEPWDFYGKNGLDAFQSAAIKYITRWRDKDGVKDLKKARHHLQKWEELIQEHVVVPNCGINMIATADYIEANVIPHDEALVITLIVDGANVESLRNLARAHLTLMILANGGEDGQTT